MDTDPDQSTRLTDVVIHPISPNAEPTTSTAKTEVGTESKETQSTVHQRTKDRQLQEEPKEGKGRIVGRGYPDLLLDSSFLLPFFSLTVVTLATFGIVRGLCAGGVPGNCSLTGSAIVSQQILICIERIFLIVVVSDLSFLFPEGWHSRTSSILYAVLMHLITIAATIVVAGGLKDYSVRHGMGPLRIGVAVILIVILLPPLFYSIICQYSTPRRWKSLGVFIVYIAFLVATAGIGQLHVHHWSWSFIYLMVFCPSVTVQESQQHCIHRSFVVWGHVSCMIAFGILIQGFAAYGSLFFFISTPWSAGDDS